MKPLLRTFCGAANLSFVPCAAFVRVALVAVIIAGLAGCRFFVDEPEPVYVPGAGYVVSVEAYFVDDGSYGRKEHFFYVFDTEADARRFMQAVRDRPGDFPPTWYRDRISVRNDTARHTAMVERLRALKQTPPAVALPPIDRAVPPVPTAPAPQ